MSLSPRRARSLLLTPSLETQLLKRRDAGWFEDGADPAEGVAEEIDMLATIKINPHDPNRLAKLTSKLPTACYPDARPNSPRAWPASVRRQAALERERLRQDLDEEDLRQDELLAQGGAVAAVRAIERAPPPTAYERAPPAPEPAPESSPEMLPPGWRRVASRSRPGEWSYENSQTGERVVSVAAACAAAAAAAAVVHAKPPPVYEHAEMPAEDLLRVVAKPSEPPLPAGWRAVPSRSRPGECSYLNTATGERVMQRPTRTAGVTADERKPLVKLGVSKRAAASQGVQHQC